MLIPSQRLYKGFCCGSSDRLPHAPNYQLPIINYHLSIINYQLSIINYQLSIINYKKEMCSILVILIFFLFLGSVCLLPAQEGGVCGVRPADDRGGI